MTTDDMPDLELALAVLAAATIAEATTDRAVNTAYRRVLTRAVLHAHT